MPVRICRKCHQSTETNAGDCPACGAKLTQSSLSSQLFMAGAVGAVGLVFILGLSWAITSYNPTVSSADREAHAAKLRSNLSTEALINCEDFVRQRLKAPASAKFGHAGLSDEAAHAQPDSSYRVSGWVDAINGYGAQLRSDYVCVVRTDGDSRWQLVSLTVR